MCNAFHTALYPRYLTREKHCPFFVAWAPFYLPFSKPPDFLSIKVMFGHRLLEGL